LVVIGSSEALRPEERVKQISKEQNGHTSGEDEFHGSQPFASLHDPPEAGEGDCSNQNVDQIKHL
jgi:hypothetical protein